MSYFTANRTEAQAEQLDRGEPVTGDRPADLARLHAQTIRRIWREHGGREKFRAWMRTREFTAGEWDAVRDAIRPLWLALPGNTCAQDALRILALCDIGLPVYGVTFEDGDTIETAMAEAVDLATAWEYYVGTAFNFGVAEDRMVRAISVEIIQP